MDLNFIRKKNDLYCADIAGDKILELYEEKDGKDLIFRAFSFDPEKNIFTEIAPEIKKYKAVSVYNCEYNSDKFYFVSYKEEDEQVVFSVYFYDLSNDELRSAFEFPAPRQLLGASEKIKLFALNNTHFLIQTESLLPDRDPEVMGAVSFKLAMYDTVSEKVLDIEIPDLVNNGINTIIPVSENRIILKCGYNFMEDKRFGKDSEGDALIESVFLTSIPQLIADISLNITTGNMQLLDTAYFEKCILSPCVRDDFVYYEIFDVKTNTSEYNFINTNTLERFKYQKTDENIKPLVISNRPYIWKDEKEHEVFLNLTNGLEDMEFTGEDLICTAGSILFFNKIRRGKDHLRLYSYPNLTMIYEEQYKLAAVCCRDDEYYIYF